MSLPSEYQEVAWLRATGTQYIATDYVPTKGDEILTSIIPDATPTANQSVFSAGTGSYQLILIIGKSNNACWFRNFSTPSVQTTYPFTHSAWHSIRMLANGTIILDDTVSATTDYQNELDGTLSSLWLFKRRNNTTPFYGKMKTFTITQNGVAKLCLVPCYRKSDNKTGMYDVVSKRFYPNAGTGEFELGSNVIYHIPSVTREKIQKRRKALIASQCQNVIPLPSTDTLTLNGGLGVKMFRKNGIVYAERSEVTSNANGFVHIVYPTTTSGGIYTANYIGLTKADKNNTFLIHPGTYKFIATVDTNVSKVWLVCGIVNMGDYVPSKSGVNLSDGKIYSEVFTTSEEALFGLAFGFGSSSFPYTLNATIKVSLVKIG